jgi:purine-nucleoside phosphorylase
MYDQVIETTEYLKTRYPKQPTLGMVLGSGLSDIVEAFEDKIEIPYKDIPNFPVSSLEGHKGSLIFGTYAGKTLVVMAGRFHHYEGFTQKQMTLPIYVMKALGVEEVIITNACGGINLAYQPGDIMLIEDFINLMGDNPLIGIHDPRLGVRFPDMTDPYSIALRTRMKAIASAFNMDLKEGVYAGFMGPYYETRAEIKMIKMIGADAVGMSTVPETIAANHAGLKVLGLAVITNMATGIQQQKHDHGHVVKMAQEAGVKLTKLIKRYLEEKEA